MAMSGGIDSTVAAMLLQDQGYELVGVTYRVYDQISQACMEKEKGCCSVNAIFEAKHMALQMGFEHHILDIRKDFNDLVIRNFILARTHAQSLRTLQFHDQMGKIDCHGRRVRL